MSAIGHSTIAGLHRALVVRVRALVAAFWTMSEADPPAPPTVVEGWLPPRGDSSPGPFVIVRPRTGTDTVEGADQHATATVDLVLGFPMADGDKEWIALVNLIDAIRQDVLAVPVLAGTACEHIGPLTWTLPDDQARPEWRAVVTTVWQLPRPQRTDAGHAED